MATPISIIIVGMTFNHKGNLHLADIFGINQIIIEPEITDSRDIVIIGFITAGDSTDDEQGL